jgi:hypothetical protein
MNENILRRIFVIGILLYGFSLIAMMGKQNNEVAKTQMAQARYADMPPAFELRQENQMAVIYKGN